jgi:hypothetical protein
LAAAPTTQKDIAVKTLLQMVVALSLALGAALPAVAADDCSFPTAHVDSFSATSGGATLTLTLLGGAGCGPESDTVLTGVSAGFFSTLNNNNLSLFVIQPPANGRTITISVLFQNVDSVNGGMRFTSPDYLNGGGIDPHIGSAFFSASVSSVPEPETYAMLLVGLGLMGLAARRRKR